MNGYWSTPQQTTSNVDVYYGYWGAVYVDRSTGVVTTSLDNQSAIKNSNPWLSYCSKAALDTANSAPTKSETLIDTRKVDTSTILTKSK